MTDVNKEKVNVDPKEATAMARAIFVAQKGKEDETSFKDVKTDTTKLARKVLRVLNSKGFKLTKIDS